MTTILSEAKNGHSLKRVDVLLWANKKTNISIYRIGRISYCSGAWLNFDYIYFSKLNCSYMRRVDH